MPRTLLLYIVRVININASQAIHFHPFISTAPVKLAPEKSGNGTLLYLPIHIILHRECATDCC